MTRPFALALSVFWLVLVPAGGFAAETQVRYRVTGLFDPGRVADLRKLSEDWNEVRLVSVDYETAIGIFAYDPASPMFQNANPEQVQERINQQVRDQSRGAFSVRPPSTFPRESLQKVEIRVVPIDCRACSLGAYSAVCNLEGVERATASLKDGQILVWIDPSKTNREALETAVKQRELKLSSE